MEPRTPSRKRKPSISYAARLAKRTRSVSISLKVSHDPVPTEASSNPEISVVSKNPQACFSGLPEELIVNILKLLGPEPHSTLAKMCRTGKRCKRIAEELLYEDMDFGSLEHGEAKVLARNVSLAKHVKKLGLVFSTRPEVLNRHSSKKEIVQAIGNSSNVQHIKVTDVQQWKPDRVSPAQEEDWLELFSNALPDFVDKASNRFHHLKELTLYSPVLSISEISSLFCLPALEVLVLDKLHQTEELSWSFTEASCRIQKLELRSAFVDIGAVIQVLSFIRALKSFFYEYDTSSWQPLSHEDHPRAHWPSHSWERLGTALQKHSYSLEELTVAECTDEDMLDIIYPDGRDVGTLGSFRDFPRLNYVKAPLDAFLDIDSGDNDLSPSLPPHMTEVRNHAGLPDTKLWVSASRYPKKPRWGLD